jgi:hypothetical protein
MTQVIIVEPDEQGSGVRQPAIQGLQLFASGAKADVAARRLAADFAEQGQAAEIQVYIRGGVLAGRIASSAGMDGKACLVKEAADLLDLF